MTSLVLGAMACSSSSPTAPESPGIPAAPGPSLSSATWDNLQGLLSDPFILELTSGLSDPAAGGPVRQAIDASALAVQGRNSGTLISALERVGTAIGTYRQNAVLGDDDMAVLDVIQNIVDLGRDWIALGFQAVSVSPDAPDGSPATLVSPSAAAPAGSTFDAEGTVE